MSWQPAKSVGIIHKISVPPSAHQSLSLIISPRANFHAATRTLECVSKIQETHFRRLNLHFCVRKPCLSPTKAAVFCLEMTAVALLRAAQARPARAGIRRIRAKAANMVCRSTFRSTADDTIDNCVAAPLLPELCQRQSLRCVTAKSPVRSASRREM